MTMQDSLKILKDNLSTEKLGHEILYFQKLSSTNDEARKQSETGVSEGLVVIADVQTEGRGRRGRLWESPIGGLWFTIVLRPDIEIKSAPLLTLLTGMVVANTIRSQFKLNATLKWPNDVRINGKKVCGILTELSTEKEKINFVLIGVGLNVNNATDQFPEELQPTVTTLVEETGHDIDKNNLILALLQEIEQAYLRFCEKQTENSLEIISKWRELSDTIGRNVKIETVSSSFSGRAIDISENGALIVKNSSGEIQRIIAGDCIYLNQLDM